MTQAAAFSPLPTPAYGPAHGVVTPMANPTAEVELSLLLGGSTLVARAVSRATDSRARLLDYIAAIEPCLEQFDVAPLRAAGFACTCHYLTGPEAEATLLDRLARRFGYPVHSSTTAIRAACAEMGVTRLALLAPYPAWLGEAAVRYFAAVGITITARLGLPTDLIDTRGIYRLQPRYVADLAAKLDTTDALAILIGGTGMPSLDLIAAGGAKLPVISSNLALAAAMSGAGVAAFLDPAATWRARLAAWRKDTTG